MEDTNLSDSAKMPEVDLNVSPSSKRKAKKGSSKVWKNYLSNKNHCCFYYTNFDSLKDIKVRGKKKLQRKLTREITFTNLLTMDAIEENECEVDKDISKDEPETLQRNFDSSSQDSKDSSGPEEEPQEKSSCDKQKDCKILTSSNRSFPNLHKHDEGCIHSLKI
ncbi:unnamed protein product [Moneuplotes crassus]|uniref:Uncharacterized protein n=1 Tax=Euplotes crassus TaxID=5936 RepID=A0AAD1XVS7_EUPCR|nr:unnamed protein product [Moneuplotes crassus]